jgi:3-phosphoshikimate 1-carboxyvinyltransferase
MPLPEVIQIEPLPAPVRAVVEVPGSKSLTNRALILAALARGETRLRGALGSEDTQVMVECLNRLGASVEVRPEPGEPANREMRVRGLGGRRPRGGSPEAPLELFVGNAGTAARFLAALVTLGEGCFRLRGVPRMHERPQAELFAALRELGYRVDAPNDRLPAVIHGGGPRAAACRVSAAASSQFASALLLVARAGGWRVEVTGTSEAQLPYVTMTRRLIEAFPPEGGEFQIEPDASSGSYFWALNAPGMEAPGGPHEVRVAHWPDSGWQPDAAFPRFLPLPAELSRQRDLADSIMTAIVLAPLAGHPVRFTDLGRLRVQECERVAALRTELTKCGARVTERGDTLEIQPSPMHGADIATYDDHRMAMCFAILGLKVPGLRLHNPACVKKTFPNFFAKLAALHPTGGGVREAATGTPLTGEDLLAE